MLAMMVERRHGGAYGQVFGLWDTAIYLSWFIGL